MDIIKELEHYRLEHRLTQAKLAEKLGVKLLTVQRWLNNSIKPGIINEHRIKIILEEIKGASLEMKKRSQLERKDPLAWEKLGELGRKISKEWKSSKKSWQLLSESRR
ncbi:MAG: hypothetical protein A2297_10185 [Elusimicrobia bacterium RIFOXYB2_FULL_48_7]|nr:MAG: hypothetical protein A2297_10185 [Elusimicrobia bacterium RIFOXYB2_FULL_48_7]